MGNVAALHLGLQHVTCAQGKRSVSVSSSAALGDAPAALSALQSLHVCSNDIGDCGIIPITVALFKLRALTFLGIAHNSAGEVAADSLARLLPALPALRRIDARGNAFTSDALARLRARGTGRLVVAA